MPNNSSSSKKPRGRAPKELNPKKYKKKTSVLVTEKIDYVDYKDVNLLARFVSDRSKIRNRRVTGNDVQQQREVANAVKNAREMALLPYTKRVSQTRAPRSRDGEGRRDRDSDGERGDRGDRGDRGERGGDRSESTTSTTSTTSGTAASTTEATPTPTTGEG
jgi:small subunit ribosomal protein S18